MRLLEKLEDISWTLPSGETVVELDRLKDLMKKIEVKGKCPACDASLKRYWHKLTPGLVKTLVKVYVKVSEKEENVIDKKELDLDHDEYGNYQKLRYHALIAKGKIDGKFKKGVWVITRRGADFVKGKIEVPKKVKTYRNRIVDRGEVLVKVKDVIGSDPYLEKEFDFDYQQLKINT